MGGGFESFYINESIVQTLHPKNSSACGQRACGHSGISILLSHSDLRFLMQQRRLHELPDNASPPAVRVIGGRESPVSHPHTTNPQPVSSVDPSANLFQQID